MQATLLRGLSILSKLPLIVTLIDLGKGPVFQNELSIRYAMEEPTLNLQLSARSVLDRKTLKLFIREQWAS
jgi:hypothetical protein